MITTEELKNLESELERESRNLLRLQAISEQRERKIEEDKQEIRDLGYDPDNLDQVIQDLEENCMQMLVELKSSLNELVQQRTKYDNL